MWKTEELRQYGRERMEASIVYAHFIPANEENLVENFRACLSFQNKGSTRAARPICFIAEPGLRFIITFATVADPSVEHNSDFKNNPLQTKNTSEGGER